MVLLRIFQIRAWKGESSQSLHNPSFKVIPQYCIAHPYCVRFLVSLVHAISARTLTTWWVSYEAKLAREIKGHLLLNDHGDLSFFLHSLDKIIILFELKEFKKIS